MRYPIVLSILACISFTASCGDGGGNDADRIGVGAQCTTSADCPDVEFQGDAGIMQLQCLTTFNGGYCGLANCANNSECPAGSVCIAHDDPVGSFCLRTCTAKAECNVNRDADHEANCNGGSDPQDPADESEIDKVCYPSSSGV